MVSVDHIAPVGVWRQTHVHEHLAHGKDEIVTRELAHGLGHENNAVHIGEHGRIKRGLGLPLFQEGQI